MPNKRGTPAKKVTNQAGKRADTRSQKLASGEAVAKTAGRINKGMDDMNPAGRAGRERGEAMEAWRHRSAEAGKTGAKAVARRAVSKAAEHAGRAGGSAMAMYELGKAPNEAPKRAAASRKAAEKIPGSYANLKAKGLSDAEIKRRTKKK